MVDGANPTQLGQLLTLEQQLLLKITIRLAKIEKTLGNQGALVKGPRAACRPSRRSSIRSTTTRGYAGAQI